MLLQTLQCSHCRVFSFLFLPVPRQTVVGFVVSAASVLNRFNFLAAGELSKDIREREPVVQVLIR